MEAKEKIREFVKEVDWGRLAAYIDGEGCIRIDLQKASKGNAFTARHLLEVRVYNSDLELILWCKNTFGGGNIKPVRNRKASTRHKQEHVWYVGALNAETVLRNCLPFFIIKRKQALVALALRELGGKHGQKVSPELYAKREVLRQEMKVLNQRGVVVTTPSQEN
jgi:hypothetical protein